MEVIGERLKTSREEKSLSLEEVSEDLKISVNDLINIESGNRGAFSDIFLLKKNIYDYAKYLGLDYDKFIEDFNEYVFESTSRIPVDVIERISKQKEKEEANREAISPYTIDNSSKQNKKIVLFAIIALLVIISIISIVIIYKNNNEEVNSMALAKML